MIRCMECGAQFETPQTVTECIGEYWGQPAYYDFQQCPECGSDYLEEMDRCECGEWTTGEWCDLCLEIRNEAVKLALKTMMKTQNLTLEAAEKLLFTYWEELEC